MLDTAAAAPYDPEGFGSTIGKGSGDRLWRALYASAEVESELFALICDKKGFATGLHV
jgi:hypothetical protein